MDPGQVCPAGLYSSGTSRPLVCFPHEYKGARGQLCKGLWDSARTPSAPMVGEVGNSCVPQKGTAYAQCQVRWAGSTGWLETWGMGRKVRLSQAPVAPRGRLETADRSPGPGLSQRPHTLRLVSQPLRAGWNGPGQNHNMTCSGCTAHGLHVARGQVMGSRRAVGRGPPTLAVQLMRSRPP